jgi:TetR/AcrR family transcriptional repressor of nem operon
VRVTRAQAAANRDRIIAGASRLFREKGIAGVAVADLMEEAGLTHGGFYGHFASKDDLAAEACRRTLGRSAEKWRALADGARAKPLAAIVANYLSARHRDNPGGGCSFATLAVDVARQDGPIRRAFTDGLRALFDVLSAYVPGRTAAARRKKALATMSGLVGAMVLARVVDDPALSDEILAAAAAEFSG